MKKIILYSTILLTLVACKPELEKFTPSAGDANFSKYVALGNSLSAGYSDGALYIDGQKNSFTNILAQQFKLAGGGEFKIPYMLDNNGVGFLDDGTPVTKRILINKTDCKGITSLAPDFAGMPNLLNLAPIGNQGPFNNLGVPAAKSFHLLTPLLGNPIPVGNPFYRRIASNPGTSTLLGDAVSQNPTFYTLWIGNNDALLYAVKGGEEGPDSITPPAKFNTYLTGILNMLKTTNAKGAIANIPNVTDLPYFTTVPYNALVLTNPADVTGLNAAYSALGITFQLGANPLIIQVGSELPRQIKSNEYILLSTPQDSIKCKGWGSLKPIPGQYVLDENEIGLVQAAIGEYNTTIAAFSNDNANNLAFVDMNGLMKRLTSGINFDGVSLTTKYVTGGAFSLDGIHLTPIGNAYAANEFLRAINAKYNAQIPLVNAGGYGGVKFP
jgi:hypothetical protein